MSGDKSVKTFDLVNRWSGYDLGTFSGRLRHFWEIVSPEKCMYKDEEILDYQKRVEKTLAEKADYR